jgi:RNA polymerase sigma-70 factor (ECF subfamily)
MLQSNRDVISENKFFGECFQFPVTTLGHFSSRNWVRYIKMTDKAEEFERYRTKLEGLAYRILGSIADAQDVVQETWLRWYKIEKGSIKNIRSWLITVCSRIALDKLKLVSRKRESYVGPWLPEPWLIDENDPSQKASVDESVSIGLLLIMETLNPVERASFLLHDVFDVSFKDIATTLGKDESTCRKAASRARGKIRSSKPQKPSNTRKHIELGQRFFDAVKSADFSLIESMLSQEIRLISDSDGKANAAMKVITNAKEIASLMTWIGKNYKKQGVEVDCEIVWFSGAPGFVFFEKGLPTAAYQFEFQNELIKSLYVHRNPEKLHPLGQCANGLTFS